MWQARVAPAFGIDATPPTPSKCTWEWVEGRGRGANVSYRRPKLIARYVTSVYLRWNWRKSRPAFSSAQRYSLRSLRIARLFCCNLGNVDRKKSVFIDCFQKRCSSRMFEASVFWALILMQFNANLKRIKYFFICLYSQTAVVKHRP